MYSKRQNSFRFDVCCAAFLARLRSLILCGQFFVENGALLVYNGKECIFCRKVHAKTGEK